MAQIGLVSAMFASTYQTMPSAMNTLTRKPDPDDVVPGTCGEPFL